MTIWDDLKAEFPREAVSWRAQTLTKNGDKALALAYIDARDVMNRLDSIVGPQNWQNRYEVHGNKTICYLSIGIDGGNGETVWITKADGAGDTDVEAEKGSISDALKRAAVLFGIGRYLYDMPATWVPCETYEKGGKLYWSKWSDDPWNYVRGRAQQQEPSTPKPKETKYPLQEGERRQLWERMMNDLKGEAPKGADAMVRYMQSKETQEDLAKLEPWRQNFRKEAAELVEATRAAEGIAGEKGATIKRIKAPDFSALAPNDLDPIEQLVGRHE